MTGIKQPASEVAPASCPACLKTPCRCAANAQTRATQRKKHGRRMGEYIPPELRGATADCPVCRGAGFVLRRGERFDQKIVDCTRCAGAGRITVK